MPNSESEKQRMFRKIDNADQTVLKINLGIDKLFKEITNNSFNMMPCAKTQFAGGRHNRKTHKKHESQSETGINSPSSLLTAEKVKDRIKFYFGASN